jgi:hypothetical protein
MSQSHIETSKPILVMVGFPKLCGMTLRNRECSPPQTPSWSGSSSSLCPSPLYVVQEPLQDEGFTDVQYVNIVGVERAPVSGQVDPLTHCCGPLSIRLAKGTRAPCWRAGIQAVSDCSGLPKCPRLAN